MTGAEKKVPANLEAEQQFLGACLMHNEIVAGVAVWLPPEAFHQPLHGRIWERIVEVVRAGGTANPVTLKTHFDLDDAMEEMGGAGYMMDLVGRSVTPLRAEEYAHILLDLWIRRRLIADCDAAIERARAVHLDDPAAAQLGGLIGSAQSLMHDLPSSEEQRDGGDLAARVIEKLKSGKQDPGVPTGLKGLTNLIGGWYPGDLVIVGGRPGMGKSVMLWHFTKAAAHAATKGESGGACLISLEMPAEQLMIRALADAAFDRDHPLPYHDIRRGQLQAGWMERIERAGERLAGLPFVIDDSVPRTVDRVEAALHSADKKLQEKHGKRLGIALIDYLQLMGGEMRGQQSRQQQIAEITKGLKRLAKRMGIPIVVGAQVGRQVEQRENKRPQLSDLREAGDLENDADTVIFLYREFYYEIRNKPAQDSKIFDWRAGVENCRYDLEAIVAKQRNGPTDTVMTWFDEKSGRVADESPAAPDANTLDIGGSM